MRKFLSTYLGPLVCLSLMSGLGYVVVFTDPPRPAQASQPPAAKPREANLTIQGDLNRPPYTLVQLSPGGVDAGAAVIWDVFPEEQADIVETGGKLIFTGPPGTYKVKLRSIKGSDVGTARATVTIGTPGPGPGPGPNPPPTPLAGLRALILYESADLGKMPAAQETALRSKAVRDYLDSKCVKGPSGTAEWRCWDKDVSPAGETPQWQALYNRPHASTPWLVIADGANNNPVYEGPLPGTEAELLGLLKKFGG